MRSACASSRPPDLIRAPAMPRRRPQPCCSRHGRAPMSPSRMARDVGSGGTTSTSWCPGRPCHLPPVCSARHWVLLGRVPGALPRRPVRVVAMYTEEVALRDMTPDMAALAELDRNAVIVTAPGIESDIVVRVFAPKAGLPEDPAPGTAHRFLSPFWCERFGRKRLHSRHLSPPGRRSLVRVRRHNGHDRRPDPPLSGRGVVTPRRIVVSWVDLVLLLTS